MHHAPPTEAGVNIALGGPGCEAHMLGEPNMPPMHASRARLFTRLSTHTQGYTTTSIVDNDQGAICDQCWAPRSGWRLTPPGPNPSWPARNKASGTDTTTTILTSTWPCEYTYKWPCERNWCSPSVAADLCRNSRVRWPTSAKVRGNSAARCRQPPWRRLAAQADEG